MGLTLEILFCVLIISIKMLTVQSAVYASPDTALIFSHCLVGKMSSSPVFTLADRNSMTAVANAMGRGMENLRYNPSGPFSPKVLLVAFATSLADVITTDDVSKNSFRKGVYAVSLEQCSLSTIGYVDTEFIKESLRIISTLEENKTAQLPEKSSFGNEGSSSAGIYNPERHPQPSVASDPFAVIPSRVQIPFIPENSNSNDRTIFGLPQSHADFSPLSQTWHKSPNTRFPVKLESDGHLPSFVASSSSQGGDDSAFAHSKSETVQSEYDYSFGESFVAPSFEFGEMSGPRPQQSSQVENSPMASETGLKESIQDHSVPRNDGQFQYPAQSSGNEKFYLGPDIGSMESNSKSSEISESSDSTSLSETSQETSSYLGGLNVPQMKESSIVGIPPALPEQKSESSHSQDHQDHSLPENSETLYPSSTEISSPQKSSSFAMTSSAFLPHTNDQGQDVPFSPALEDLIANILANSTDFINAFNFGINTEQAIKLSRVITEQSLAGYDSNIIREALNAVSNAVATVRISSPENYALALSDALVSVLKLHNLPLFVDGSKIATSMLFNLESTTPGSPENVGEQYTENIKPNDTVQLEHKELPFDSQASEVTPKDTYGEIFIKELTQNISKSDEMKNFFCINDMPPNKMQIYFSIIKPSLHTFGSDIASIGAGVIASVLADLSDEDLCSYYAQAISTAIKEILEENGLLAGANPEYISNRIDFSLSLQFPATTKSQEPDIVPDDMSAEGTTKLPSGTLPILQSSFSSHFDQSDQETSALPEIYSQFSTYSTSSFEDMNYAASDVSPGENYNIKSVPYLFAASPSPVDAFGSEELTQIYEAQDDYTSPSSIKISDENPFSPSWMESLSHLADTSTERPKNANSDYVVPVISDDIIDQEELASFLIREMEFDLDALSEKYSDQDTASSIPEYHTTETEREIISITSNPLMDTNKTQAEQSNNARKPQQNRRRKKKRRTTSQPNTTVLPSTPILESTESDHITLPEHQVKNRSSREHPESRVLVEEDEATTISETYSKSFNFKSSLEPSFQARQPSEFSSVSSKAQKPTIITYDSEYEEVSFVFANTVSQIAADAIAFIRSERFDVWELCGKLNDFAPILRIPPLDVCEEIPAIDYLLHVLRRITKVLKGV